MGRRALLISTPTAFSGSETGGGLRAIQIQMYLTSLNFQIEHISAEEIQSLDFYDLICVVSFANARLLSKVRGHCDYLWYDATDSWRLTRRSLFRLSPTKEFLRLVRDFVYATAYRKADLVTYCTQRDLEADRCDFATCLVMPNKMKPSSIDHDHGFRFVFVGPHSYPPNRSAIDFLITVVNHPQFDTVPLHIYSQYLGNVSNARNVTFHPSTPFRELYGVNDIHLVPILHGAGMKYKTLVPLSLGLKVISTKEGAIGFIKSENLQVVSSLEEFKDAMVRALKSSSHFQKTPALPEYLIYERDDSPLISKTIDSRIKVT
jgi:hypothetical protein